jgi:hypothetical protein
MNIVDYIKNLTQETAIIIQTETEVKMNKKDVETKTEPNPYIGAVKKSLQIVKVNPNYEREVNDQREDEGKERTFEASERKWGTALGNGVIENNGKMYISYIPVSTIETSYEDSNGEKIEYSELEKFIPKKKDSSAEKQGVEDVVKFRMIAVENIKSFKG